MDSCHKVQTCPPSCRRGCAGQLQVIRRLLIFSLLLGGLGQVTGLRVSGDGEQGGFSARDTVVVTESSKRGCPLRESPGETNQVIDSECKDGVINFLKLSSNKNAHETEKQGDDVAKMEPENTGGAAPSALSRTKRTVNSVVFECPTDRCEENDCYVARPDIFMKRKWTWATYDKRLVETELIKPGRMKVKFTLEVPQLVPLELWCFTKQQLDSSPDCKLWDISYPERKGKPKFCKADARYEDEFASPYFLFAAAKDQDDAKTEQIVQDLTKDKSQQPVEPKVNSAISLMIDYARDRNFSNCWLCQNMPRSIHSPMLSPIPFTKADYEKSNWNDLSSRLNDDADDCYTPTYPIDSVKSAEHADIARHVAQSINDQYLPAGFNHTTLLRIIHIQMYVKLGFEYRVQVSLTQTNCSEPPEGKVCVPQPYTSTILAEALVYVQPWTGSMSIGLVKVQVRNCTEPQQSEQTPLRDCSVYLPPVPTHALQNVPLCFRGVGSGQEELGQSSCNTVVNVTLKQSPLPERVYLICGDKAYSCMPYEESKGIHHRPEDHRLPSLHTGRPPPLPLPEKSTKYCRRHFTPRTLTV